MSPLRSFGGGETTSARTPFTSRMSSFLLENTLGTISGGGRETSNLSALSTVVEETCFIITLLNDGCFLWTMYLAGLLLEQVEEQRNALSHIRVTQFPIPCDCK